MFCTLNVRTRTSAGLLKRCNECEWCWRQVERHGYMPQGEDKSSIILIGVILFYYSIIFV